MAHTSTNTSELEGFVLGTPALVCRWRLAGRGLPLENRHIRALAWRTIAGERLSTELVAWVKQHLEWTLKDGSFAHPDGVLMLIIDEQGKAAMTVGDFEPLEVPTTSFLAQRAHNAEVECAATTVAPETLWLARDDRLVAGISAGSHSSGATALIMQLASTLGIPVVREERLADKVLSGDIDPYDEVFLVSDEHGVVPAHDKAGSFGHRFAASYERLLEAERKKRNPQL